MIRLLTFTLILAGWAAVAGADDLPRLTPDGLGPLRIGMREADAVKRFGLQTARDDGVSSFECRDDLYPRYPGVAVMAENGKITRIAAHSPSRLRTDSGLGIGSKEVDVRRAYSNGLGVSTRPYDDEPAHELIAWTEKGTRGVRYDTDAQGRVVAIFVGGKSIEYIEGCL